MDDVNEYLAYIVFVQDQVQVIFPVAVGFALCHSCLCSDLPHAFGC